MKEGRKQSGDVTPLFAICLNSASVGLATDPLNGDSLGLHHLGLKGVHAGRRFVDLTGERDRPCEDRGELVALLYPRGRVLMLDDEGAASHVEFEELAGRKLVVEPVDAAILQVGQGIMPRRAGQLMLTDRDLLLPSVEVIDGIGRRLAANAVAPLHRLTAVTPGTHSLGVEHLPLHVEAANQEGIALILEVLENRARVLPHQNRMGGVVVDTKLIADAMTLADAMKGDPSAGCVADVVVEGVVERPPRHGALLDSELEISCLRLLEQRDEGLLKVDEVGVDAALLVLADEATDRLHTKGGGSIKDTKHEVLLLPTHFGIGMQQVVEVGKVCNRHPARCDRSLNPLGSLGVKGVAKIERVGHGIEHRFCRDVGDTGVKRGRELNLVRSKLPGELQPLLDCKVGIGVSPRSRRQLLKGGGQDAHSHIGRFEGLHDRLRWQIGEANPRLQEPDVYQIQEKPAPPARAQRSAFSVSRTIARAWEILKSGAEPVQSVGIKEYCVTIALKTVGLEKSFGKNTVLKGLDLEVEAGQVFGFIGPNGAGKTTTVRILTGLSGSFEGEAEVAGIQVREDLLALKRVLGYVPEQARLYEELSGCEYLTLAGRLRELPEELALARAERFLEIFDLSEFQHSRLSSYSKGMRQKVVLSAALMGDPEVLFLDEPLSGLDVGATILIKDLIRALADAGKTVFYCSHMMDVVERVCDRIVIIDDGRIVADGTFDELSKSHASQSLETIFSNLTAEQSSRNRAAELLDAMRIGS